MSRVDAALAYLDRRPEERFSLYRLCACPECEGHGKNLQSRPLPPLHVWVKCAECRGEGRVRQELASCESPEAIGVALVTLAREGEWEECAFGLLDRKPEGKETGTWLILPWLPSARNVTDAARTLARSKRTPREIALTEVEEGN